VILGGSAAPARSAGLLRVGLRPHRPCPGQRRGAFGPKALVGVRFFVANRSWSRHLANLGSRSCKCPKPGRCGEPEPAAPFCGPAPWPPESSPPARSGHLRLWPLSPTTAAWSRSAPRPATPVTARSVRPALTSTCRTGSAPCVSRPPATGCRTGDRPRLPRRDGRLPRSGGTVRLVRNQEVEGQVGAFAGRPTTPWPAAGPSTSCSTPKRGSSWPATPPGRHRPQLRRRRDPLGFVDLLRGDHPRPRRRLRHAARLLLRGAGRRRRAGAGPAAEGDGPLRP